MHTQKSSRSVSSRPLSTVDRANRGRLSFRRRFRRLLRSSGGSPAAGGEGEPPERRAVYIPYTSSSIGRSLGLSVPPAATRAWLFCLVFGSGDGGCGCVAATSSSSATDRQESLPSMAVLCAAVLSAEVVAAPLAYLRGGMFSPGCAGVVEAARPWWSAFLRPFLHYDRLVLRG